MLPLFRLKGFFLAYILGIIYFTPLKGETREQNSILEEFCSPISHTNREKQGSKIDSIEGLFSSPMTHQTGMQLAGFPSSPVGGKNRTLCYPKKRGQISAGAAGCSVPTVNFNVC